MIQKSPVDTCNICKEGMMTWPRNDEGIAKSIFAILTHQIDATVNIAALC